MEKSKAIEVYPGKLLVASSASMIAGEGTYVYLGKIYSNLRGTTEIVPKKSWNNQEDLDRI